MQLDFNTTTSADDGLMKSSGMSEFCGEMEGVGRRQLLDDLSKRRTYWEIKEEAEDQNIEIGLYLCT